MAPSFLVLCLQPRSTSPSGWIPVWCVTAGGAFVTPPRAGPGMYSVCVVSGRWGLPRYRVAWWEERPGISAQDGVSHGGKQFFVQRNA